MATKITEKSSRAVLFAAYRAMEQRALNAEKALCRAEAPVLTQISRQPTYERMDFNALREAAKRYCAQHNVRSCTKEQALTCL